MSGLFNLVSRTIPQTVKLSKCLLQNPNNIRTLSLASCLRAPQILEPAPNFEGMAVIGEKFKQIKLEDFKGKYVVLVFYPLDFTFVCPTELKAFEEKYDDFKKLNAEVIGCSIDSHYCHYAWTKTKKDEGGLGSIRYPLLSDINKVISRDYGVLIEKEGIALRGTFVIDPNGVLRQITVNDLPIGRSIMETLRVIEALKFHEEHGEVCPANWKKGDKTIKPDPQGSKEFFKATDK